ncbi:hypothetical protein [Ekhidna sp.]
MKNLVRICSWFTLILGSALVLTSVVMLFSKEISTASVFTEIFFVSATVIGWTGRKYGSSDHSNNKLSKISAIVVIIFGFLLIVFIPILSINLFGFNDSYLAIRNIIIIFAPMVIVAIAVLRSK